MTSSQSPDLKSEELYRSRDHEHSTCSALDLVTYYTKRGADDLGIGEVERLLHAAHTIAADARRYCYLRSRDAGAAGEAPPPGVFIGLVPANVILTEEDADQAIDAALSSAKPAARDSSRDETLRAQLALAVGVLRPLADHADAMEAQHQDYHTPEGPLRSQLLCEAYQALAALSPQQDLEGSSRAESVTPLASQGGDTEAQSPAGGELAEAVRREREMALEITGLRNSYWEERRARRAAEVALNKLKGG